MKSYTELPVTISIWLKPSTRHLSHLMFPGIQISTLSQSQSDKTTEHYPTKQAINSRKWLIEQIVLLGKTTHLPNSPSKRSPPNSDYRNSFSSAIAFLSLTKVSDFRIPGTLFMRARTRGISNHLPSKKLSQFSSHSPNRPHLLSKVCASSGPLDYMSVPTRALKARSSVTCDVCCRIRLALERWRSVGNPPV